MVAVYVVYVDILEIATFVVNISIAWISLKLLNYEIFGLPLIIFRYAAVKPINVLNHFILASHSRTYEVL